jgi:hypothetical protein
MDDDLGFESRQGLGIFLVSRPALGPTRPAIQWILEGLYLRVKRPGSEADNSPPSSAKVKNAWSYTSTPQYVFMAWCLVKAQGQLYVPFTSTSPKWCLPFDFYDQNCIRISHLPFPIGNATKCRTLSFQFPMAFPSHRDSRKMVKCLKCGVQTLAACISILDVSH